MTKNINKFDWEPLTVLTDDEVHVYFKRSKYMFRCTHSGCTVEDHDCSHSSLVAYYSCVSKHCFCDKDKDEDKDKDKPCPARRLLKKMRGN